MLQKIQHYLEKIHIDAIDVACLTEQYASGQWHLDEKGVNAYLAVRLPATLAVLNRILPEAPTGDSLLDFGAGPGTTALATEIPTTHIEHNPHFLKLARKLDMPGKWQRELPTEPHDLVLCSYSLGESMHMLEKLWPLAKKALIIIEPGTPQGYRNMLAAREKIIQQGGYVAAPCPHERPCPMTSGWCHFGVKVERTQLHRRLKGGTLGYEEEKYSFVILTREEPIRRSRILHVPQKRGGHIRLTLCAPEGIIEKVVTRKEKEFKQVKKKRWGESIS